MTLPSDRFRRLGLAGLALALVLGGYAGLQLTTASPAHAATSQFHGVNWADPNDNFITRPNVPVGLSTSDSYATVYAKATAILKGFQALGANTVRMASTPGPRRPRGGTASSAPTTPPTRWA